MGSASYANTSGTLNNNMNITVNGIQPAENVNIAVHNMTNKSGAAEIKQVHMNNSAEKHLLTLDADGDGQYVFNASYVKAPNSQTLLLVTLPLTHCTPLLITNGVMSIRFACG